MELTNKTHKFNYGTMTGFLIGIRTQQGIAITEDEEEMSFTTHGFYFLMLKFEWMTLQPING